jgi:hypothetical protein
VRVVNGHGSLLASFGSLIGGSIAVVDVDFSRHGANAWLVGMDSAGLCWQSRVELNRGPDGRWVSGASSDSTWQGWAEPGDRGPIQGLGMESGGGSPPNRRFTAVHGVAASDVVAVEVALGDWRRRRPVDSPTGGFIVTIPGWLADGTPTVRAIY